MRLLRINEATNFPSFGGQLLISIHVRPPASIHAGEVIGNVGGYADRIEGQSGLECSGDTCHVNKKWPDCECTSERCAVDEATAKRNAADPKNSSSQTCPVGEWC